MDLDITNPTNVGMETPQNIFENLFAGLWENLVRSVQETFLSRFCSPWIIQAQRERQTYRKLTYKNMSRNKHML